MVWLTAFSLLGCGAASDTSDAGPNGDAGNVDGGSTSSAPTVTSTTPSESSTGVPLNAHIAVTFSVPMDPTTLTATTITMKQGATLAAGAVTAAGATAMLAPTTNLAPSSVYIVTVTTGAKSATGLALAAEYSWSFTTGTTVSLGPAPVSLGSAGGFAVLAESAVSTVPASVVTGDVALSPSAASFITGFSLTADKTNVFSDATQVIGKVYAADYAVPTPTNLTTAVGNMENAYTDAAGRPNPDHLELGTGAIGGLTLAPGLYKWTSTVTILSDVVISGGADDVWIFEMSGDLTEAAAMSVTLQGGALAKNIFWQVAGQATIGANAHFEGVLLSKTGITLETGSTMNGRLFAQKMIALQQASVTQPAP